MNKRFGMLLVSAMALGLLTGCGGGEDTATTTAATTAANTEAAAGSEAAT